MAACFFCPAVVVVVVVVLDDSFDFVWPQSQPRVAKAANSFNYESDDAKCMERNRDAN